MSRQLRTLIGLVVAALGLSSVFIALPLRLLYGYLERSEREAEEGRAEPREPGVEARRRDAESEKEHPPDLDKRLVGLDPALAVDGGTPQDPAPVPSAAARPGGAKTAPPSGPPGQQPPARGPAPRATMGAPTVARPARPKVNPCGCVPNDLTCSMKCSLARPSPPPARPYSADGDPF